MAPRKTFKRSTWLDSSQDLRMVTLPETNIAPENGWLEDYFPIGEAYVSGAMSVSGSICPGFFSERHTEHDLPCKRFIQNKNTLTTMVCRLHWRVQGSWMVHLRRFQDEILKINFSSLLFTCTYQVVNLRKKDMTIGQRWRTSTHILGVATPCPNLTPSAKIGYHLASCHWYIYIPGTGNRDGSKHKHMQNLWESLRFFPIFFGSQNQNPLRST